MIGRQQAGHWWKAMNEGSWERAVLKLQYAAYHLSEMARSLEYRQPSHNDIVQFGWSNPRDVWG